MMDMDMAMGIVMAMVPTGNRPMPRTPKGAQILLNHHHHSLLGLLRRRVLRTKILMGLGTRITNDRIIIITTTAHHKLIPLLVVGPLVKTDDPEDGNLVRLLRLGICDLGTRGGIRRLVVLVVEVVMGKDSMWLLGDRGRGRS